MGRQESVLLRSVPSLTVVLDLTLHTSIFHALCRWDRTRADGYLKPGARDTIEEAIEILDTVHSHSSIRSVADWNALRITSFNDAWAHVVSLVEEKEATTGNAPTLPAQASNEEVCIFIHIYIYIYISITLNVYLHLYVYTRACALCA